jgi:hypothetical protein
MGPTDFSAILTYFRFIDLSSQARQRTKTAPSVSKSENLLAPTFHNNMIMRVIMFFCLGILSLPQSCNCALSCPSGCSCISNTFDRPDIETTVVDCSFKNFNEFPSSLPNSTTELYLQVSANNTSISYLMCDET